MTLSQIRAASHVLRDWGGDVAETPESDGSILFTLDGSSWAGRILPSGSITMDVNA